MDAIDAKILAILQQNARISISQLGRMINMTQPAVRERVKRLEEQGVIRSYRAILNEEKLGKQVTAFVLVQANSCDQLIQFCEEAPEVIEMYQLSGQYNFLLKVVTETMHTLNVFIQHCSEIAFTSTMTVLSKPFEEKPILIKEDES